MTNKNCVGFYFLFESIIVLLITITFIIYLTNNNDYESINIEKHLEINDSLIVLSKVNTTDTETLTNIIKFLFDNQELTFYLNNNIIYDTHKTQDISYYKTCIIRDENIVTENNNITNFKIKICE
jgi:hypothetical protein